VTEPLSSAAQTTVKVRGTDYRLVVLRASELGPLVPLFQRSFGRREFSPEWLARKYGCEFHGIGGFACVALTASGQAVASLGVLPYPVRHANGVEVAGQLVDAATSSEHRRRGLFGQLSEMAQEVCESAGISFLFAFPHVHGNSYPGFVGSLGYRHIDDLLQYRRQVRTVAVARVAKRVRMLRTIHERHVERTLSGYAPDDAVLRNSVLSDGFAGIDRDRGFHTYKSSFAGSRVVSTEGGRAWLKVGHGLLLGDLEASAESDLEKTADALEALAVRLGVHQIVFQASRDSRFSSFFGNRYRTSPGLAVVHRDLASTIPPEKLRFTFGDLDNF
jgi:hypothetical protein